MTLEKGRSISVREMVRDDIAAVAQIERSVSPEPWSIALFEGEFDVAAHTRHWLVAEDQAAKTVVGFIGMMFVNGTCEGHVMNIAVAPGYRRSGIAAALCAEAFDHAACIGVDALTLEVRASNDPAISLYRRFGFAPVGNRPGYYTNSDSTKEDGLIMWVHDNIERSARRRVSSAEKQP